MPSGNNCCDSCQDEGRSTSLINIKEDALIILNAVKDLCELPRFHGGVNEKKLVSFVRGSSQEWLKEGDVQPVVEASKSYGKGTGHDSNWWGRVLRQCVALGLIDMKFKVSSFNRFYKTSRRYVTSSKGKSFLLKPQDISVLDPSIDPFHPRKKTDQKRVIRSSSRGIHFLPKVRKLLKDKSSWDEFASKDDYEFPGFSRDNGKLMFTADFTTLPFAAKNRIHFISEDNQLTARGSQTQKVVTKIDGKETGVYKKRIL